MTSTSNIPPVIRVCGVPLVQGQEDQAHETDSQPPQPHYQPGHIKTGFSFFSNNKILSKGTQKANFIAHTPQNVTKSVVTSHKVKMISPKKEWVSPKKEMGNPRTEIVFPRRELFSPHKSFLVPKIEMVSPQKEMAFPTQDLILKSPERSVVATPPPQTQKRKVGQRGPGKIKKLKKLKDPLEPKRPGSSFLLFSKEERPSVVEMLGTKQLGPVGAELSRRWAGLDQEERVRWDAKWREEMVKYEEEKKKYSPSQEYLRAAAVHDQKQAKRIEKTNFVENWDLKVQVGSYFTYLLTNWVKVALERPELTPKQIQEFVWVQWSSGPGKGVPSVTVQKKKKVSKDPNAPKHPMSAYTIFYKNTISEIIKASPGMPIAEAMAEVGKMWRSLDEEAREPYTREAKERLENYYEEKARYLEGLKKKQN